MDYLHVHADNPWYNFYITYVCRQHVSFKLLRNSLYRGPRYCYDTSKNEMRLFHAALSLETIIGRGSYWWWWRLTCVCVYMYRRTYVRA